MPRPNVNAVISANSCALVGTPSRSRSYAARSAKPAVRQSPWLMLVDVDPPSATRCDGPRDWYPLPLPTLGLSAIADLAGLQDLTPLL